MLNQTICEEQKAYATAWQAAQTQQDCQKSAAGEIRQDLISRLQRRQEHSAQEGRRGLQIEELLHLLKKHPEVALILDLMERVGR